MSSSNTTLFHETQQFRRPWLMLLFISGLLVPIGILVYMLTIKQVNTSELVLSTIAVLTFEIPLFALFYNSRLELNVISDGVSYRWWPLQKKFRLLRANEITEIKIRKSPARTHGMHWRFGYGWVNNMRAKRGFQFQLKSGKKIFIGSERISELKTVLEKTFKRAIEDKRNEF